MERMRLTKSVFLLTSLLGEVSSRWKGNLNNLVNQRGALLLGRVKNYQKARAKNGVETKWFYLIKHDHQESESRYKIGQIRTNGKGK